MLGTECRLRAGITLSLRRSPPPCDADSDARAAPTAGPGSYSGNSSMPPSTDDLPGRTKPVAKRAKNSGRRRGKQKDAQGNTLEWVAVPDETVPHRPHGRCGCGADLAGAHDVGIERSHQVHDLPEVDIRAWQHDVYRVRCGCGAEHVGHLPLRSVDRTGQLRGEPEVAGGVSATPACRHRRRRPGRARPGVPPGCAGRSGAGAPTAGAATLHRAVSRARAAGVLP